MTAQKLISIVTPVFNEEESLLKYHERVKNALSKFEDCYDFEIVFTDNRSTDRTFDILRQLANEDDRIHAVRFSRNFGYQRSIWTGYKLSQGDAIFVLDADLQDPPELIASFLGHWEKGFEIVYGVRRRPSDPIILTAARKAFYRIIRCISKDELPNDAGDFMLLDRKVVDYITNIFDPNIYIRGAVFSLGFSKIPIYYDREARSSGKSKFSFSSMFGLALDGIVRQSTWPLHSLFFIGALFSFVSVGLAISYLLGKVFFFSEWPAGFATTVIFQMSTIGILSLFLGVIGEYILRIYEILKGEPMTIIDEIVGGSQNKKKP